MAKNVLTVSEARRRLPQILKDVAAGRGAVYVGARGRPSVVLVEAEEYDALASRAATVAETPGGWDGLRLEIVGTEDDLRRTLDEIGQEALRAIDESWDRVEKSARPKRRAARRAR